MAGTGTGVRRRRSEGDCPRTVAVTGAAGPLGRAVVQRLVDAGCGDRVVALDVHPVDVAGAAFRRADVRDPALAARMSGVDTVVHLAASRDPAEAPDDRRPLNVRGTEVLLRAAAAAGATRIVLVTSAMVYGADAGNPVPLPEDAPLRAEPDGGLVGEWLDVERLAARAAASHPHVQVVRLRPAPLVGDVVDPVLPRLFTAPRLLLLRGSSPSWQFCHTDDLVTAIDHAVHGRVTGAVTVGADGALEQAEVERISGMRSVVVPPAVAFATAERLHRAGVLSAPAGELRYLTAPWVVGSQRLRAAGWAPAWTNEQALAAHLAQHGTGVGAAALRRDATRAAAGAAVAAAGAIAVARARSVRRRRLG